MGARERTYFELTLKGSEELAARTYRLDARVRNVLFLIQKGYQTIDGILENSIFPREDVVERLRDLLRGHFLTVQANENSSTSPTTISRLLRLRGGRCSVLWDPGPDRRRTGAPADRGLRRRRG